MCFLLLCMLFTGILNYISAQQGITASCHQNLLGDSGRSGVISSPNFPFDYYGSQDCQYKIHFQHTAARDTRRLVCFVFRRFDLVGDSAGDIGQADEGHSSLCEDYLSINSIKYCGRYGYRNGTAPKDKGDCVFEDDYCFPAPHLSFELRFVSNDVSHASGFYAEYNVLHTIDTQALQDTDRLLPNTQPVTKLANHTGVAPCQEDEWTCFNRQCITRESLCDGMADCTDGSDESYTHARCTHRPQNIYGCTVEGQEEVMCGADVGVWMRGSGQLLPAMYDHTTGTSEGHFIFSSYTGDTPTRLTFTYDHPPTHTQFPKPANDVSPPRCVRFWYYMVGDVGDLYVGVVTNGASSSIVWSRSGDQGPMWHQGLVDIPPHYTHIQEILFITRRDITKTGFIAVDDISAVDGNCYGDDISCTFDIGSCQWRSDTVKAVAWTLNAGPTPSLDTGPFGDAHGGGQYMYLEASGNEGKVADLVSGVVSNWYGTRKCLIYSYHMFGEDLGELKVYIRHTDGSEALLLAHYGNKGHAWTKAMVSVSVTLPYQLVFRAVIGQGTKSDIAIDDVILQDGHCPSHTGGSFPSDGYEGGAVGGVSTEQTNHCKADEFMCGNGRCIPDYYHCDRRIDCFDKSDEENCSFDTSAAIVALCAVGVIMLIVIVIGAFLYSRKRQYDDDARRVSSVSEMMRDYRRRAQLEQDNRLEGRRHEYNELPPQISEPPPEYLSASTDQIGQAALGPQLTMDMRFPRDRDEAPPNYDAALDSIAYMPSTIGPNPPPYTNTLPDGGFPALDNDGFEQDEEEKKAKKLCKPNKEKLATLSGGERLVGSLPRFTISSGVAEGGEDRGHSSTYIPTHHRENTITAAALSPFRSLMRRNRLARSARERNVMAHALHMEHMSRAHGRPASYDQRRDVPAGAHQAAAFHSRAERGRTPEDYTDLFPDRAATFPRSQGIEALNTISAASLARDVGVPTDVSHTDASGDDAIASEAGEAAGGAGQVNLGATGDADDSALPCVPPRSSTYREWCDAHRDGADSTVGDLDGMVPCDQHGGANHGGGANIATVSSARPVAVAAPSTLATSTAERDRLMLDEPVALQRRSLYHDHTEPSRLDGYDNRY